MTSSNIAVDYKPETYQQSSASVDAHVQGVREQYDTEEKRAFYAEVMGDGTGNIHFGKWDDIDFDAHPEGAYGKAADQMTDYMFQLAAKLRNKEDGSLAMVDLGSGTGGAALRLVPANEGLSATLLNVCPEQNATAQSQARTLGLEDRVTVHTGTYEKADMLADNTFDICFSQDALVHAFSKLTAYKEAHRVAKEDGGVLVICDLMRGTSSNEEELKSFAATNMVQDWLSPDETIQVCLEAGWKEVTYINLTPDIKKSFQLMLRKVERIVGEGSVGLDPALLNTYKTNLSTRIEQVDRGVFSWGVVHAKKL